MQMGQFLSEPDEEIHEDRGTGNGLAYVGIWSDSQFSMVERNVTRRAWIVKIKNGMKKILLCVWYAWLLLSC